MNFVLRLGIIVADENVLSILGVALLGFIIRILFFKPYNLVKDYSDFGYDSYNGRNLRKKAMITLALKRRKLGNVPPPYPNSWYAILESDELKSGQVKEVFALGQNMVAWRSEQDGKIFVADAYCPHLGAHLGVGGSVKGNCIQCPFHKWSFDGYTGKVKNIPYLSNEKTDMTKLGGLRMWQVVQTNGFVYIWYHVDNQEPTWYPEPINEIVSGQWVYHGRSEFQITCHIQEIPENGADVAHLDALHEDPALFPERFRLLTNLLARIVQHKWSVSWSISNDQCRIPLHQSHQCELLLASKGDPARRVFTIFQSFQQKNMDYFWKSTQVRSRS